jgi:hypothetical protein
MTRRGDTEGAIDAGRRMLEQAVDAGIKRAQGLNAKPTLKRYTWSRLHTDLLDDFRWSLVAKRANAPLPLVEAVLIRLENHANRSRPRGYVGDFSAEGLAARWNVDADTIARIYAQLEASDIGWIDQDQLVTFWDRNPDIVDETAAERQQRVRDRKKGMRQLAALARQGFITTQQRAERELALKDSREPKSLMAAWAVFSTDASRRDSVTVTSRADHIIKQDLRGKEESGSAIGSRGAGIGLTDGVEPVDSARAEQWLDTQGRALVTARMTTQAPRAAQLLERWKAGVEGDSPALMAIILGAVGTSAIGEAFQTVIENQIRRRAEDANGPKLPLPPVGLRNRK